jgi:hypothetical protein
MPPRPSGAEGEQRAEQRVVSSEASSEMLVWRRSTWGSYGQHDNFYTFVIKLDDLSVKPIFELVQTRHENKDSSKNIHRYTYVSLSELSKLEGCVLKFVHDYASARKREVNVRYVAVKGGALVELDCTRNLRDSQGFFDEVKLSDGRRLIVRKDGVEVK